MAKNNKRQENGIYEQFLQDDLAHPFRKPGNQQAGPEAYRSVTQQSKKLDAGEANFAQKSYEEDYAIQEGEDREQRLTEKPSRHKSLKHRCKGPQCSEVSDIEDV